MTPDIAKCLLKGKITPLVEDHCSHPHFSNNESSYYYTFICLALHSVQSPKNMFHKINFIATGENSMKKWRTVSYSALPQALVEGIVGQQEADEWNFPLGFSFFDATCSLESWGKFFVHFLSPLENVKRNTGCKESVIT